MSDENRKAERKSVVYANDEILSYNPTTLDICGHQGTLWVSPDIVQALERYFPFRTKTPAGKTFFVYQCPLVIKLEIDGETVWEALVHLKPPMGLVLDRSEMIKLSFKVLRYIERMTFDTCSPCSR